MVKPCPSDPKERQEWERKLDEDFAKTIRLFVAVLWLGWFAFIFYLAFRCAQ